MKQCRLCWTDPKEQDGGDENRAWWRSRTEAQKIKKKEKQMNNFQKQRDGPYRRWVFVHRHSSQLMGSWKSSIKNNLSCCGHELIPVGPSSEQPSKSFSSLCSVQTHPGHYCTNKTRACQGGGVSNCDAAEWKYHPPFSFFCLPISAPPLPARRLVSPSHADTFGPTRLTFTKTHRAH